ncbi:MAG: hypothetical protein EPN49_02115 [Rhodanobacter sp.]|nr:MAG: hypothetical protein EPN49_02115 [Rhodanobacter sp.]
MNHPVTSRRVPGFESWSLPSHPLRFVYFVAADEHTEHATYHDQLVIAEVLLHRVVSAKARGIQPVNLRLHHDAEQHCFQRTRSGRGLGDSVEDMRWVDRDGFSRARPLNREQLTRELMDRLGVSLLRAIDLVASGSHALSSADQSWLVLRSSLSILERPLNGSEYLILVRAIEAAYAVPPEKSGTAKSGTEKSSSCAANVAIALRAARGLGWLHEDFTSSPFRIAALSTAYKMGHYDYLARRASFARATDERLRFSHARSSVKMKAKLARHRAEHAALLASRALVAATMFDTRLGLPDAAAIEPRGTSRAMPAAANPAASRRVA